MGGDANYFTAVEEKRTLEEKRAIFGDANYFMALEEKKGKSECFVLNGMLNIKALFVYL